MKCPNCGTEHAGNFCNQCGQSNVDLHVPVGDLVREAAEEALGFDSRLRHTLKPFLFQPGELTRDYLSGRRVRYTSPLKMYLAASVLFFFSALHNPSDAVHVEPGHEASGASLGAGLVEGLGGSHPSPGKPPPKSQGRFGKFVEGQLDKLTRDPAATSRDLAASMMNTLPKAMFVLVPLFAWLLAKLWPRRFYAEHLVFAMHLHAFAMLLFVPVGFTTGRLNSLLTSAALAIGAAYLFLALRRVYGQGAARTFFKMIALGVSYSVLLGLGLMAAMVASLLSL